MEYFLALIFGAIFTFIYFYFKNKNSFIAKPKAIKKDEIIKDYEEELREILASCGENRSLQIEKRVQFLKKVNHELSMNIFFDVEESKKILQDLSKMEWIWKKFY